METKQQYYWVSAQFALHRDVQYTIERKTLFGKTKTIKRSFSGDNATTRFKGLYTHKEITEAYDTFLKGFPVIEPYGNGTETHDLVRRPPLSQICVQKIEAVQIKDLIKEGVTIEMIQKLLKGE